MKKTLMLMTPLLVAAFITHPAFAWDTGMGKGFGYGYRHGYGISSNWTDLSQEKKNQLTALEQQFMDSTYDLRLARFQKKQELRMLMETSKPDKKKLDQLIRDISELDKQLLEKRIEFELAAKKITPEYTPRMSMGKGDHHGYWSKRGRNWHYCPRLGGGNY